MLRLVLALALVSFSVEASHLDTVCKAAIKMPPVFSTSLVARTTPDYRFVIETLDGSQVYEHKSPILSMVEQDQRLWILSHSELLEMNRDGSLIKSYSISMGKNMALAGNMLLVVRAGGVMTAVNTETHEMGWTSEFQDIPTGSAAAVTFDGTNAIVAMETAQQDGFTGVATIDPKNGKVLKTSPYHVRSWGVIATDVSARWHNGQLILNNGGWIHILTAKQVASGKAMKPKWLAHVMSRETSPNYMIMRGEFLIQNNAVVGCGSYYQMVNGKAEFQTALFELPIK